MGPGRRSLASATDRSRPQMTGPDGQVYRLLRLRLGGYRLPGDAVV